MSRQPDYQTKSIFLYADRSGATSFDDSNAIDITGAVIEYEFYENIERNFISGKMMLVDTSSFRKFYKIQGTEHVQFTIDLNDDVPLIRDFIITSIEKSKSVDTGEVILLSFIEEHGYYGALERISKAFENTPEKIIAQINEEYFGRGTEEFYDPSQNHDRPIKYISPNFTPLNIIDTIRDRTTTRNGGSFFSYAKLNNNESLFVGSLDYLLELDTFDTVPFTFTQAAGEHEHVSSYYGIDAFDVKENLSTFEMARQGVINSGMTTLDTTSGLKTNPKHLSVLELVGSISESSDIDIDSELIFKLNTELQLSSIQTKNVSSIIAGRSFSRTKQISTNEPLGFHDDNPEHYILRLKSALTRVILMNSMFTIDMSGLHHALNPNAGVGSTMDINFISPTVYYKGFATEARDDNRSGKFMVYRIVHKFSEGNYRAITDVVRLGKSKS